MTFLSALDIVAQDLTKMAVPAGEVGKSQVGGIIFTPKTRPCWGWDHGGVVRLPAPKILQGEWVVVDRGGSK